VERLRITLVLGDLALGGTEQQVCRLAMELTAAGHDVRVVTLFAGGPLADDLNRSGVQWSNLGSAASDGLGAWTGLLGLPVRLWRELRGFRPDVCHAFLFWAHALALPCAALAGVPVRLSGRRSLSRARDSDPLRTALRRVGTRCSTAVVANSVAVARDVVDVGDAPAGGVRIIGNAVDVPSRAAFVERQPATGLVVANLRAYKGHGHLLEALARLPDPPHVRLVGDGPERGALEQRVAQLGLQACVSFEGQTPHAARLYEDVQFAVLCSLEEGLPNAVMEAMAAGVPVIATAVGGVPELVEDGVTGLLVPPGDPGALARAIAVVSADPALRARLGRAARARVAARSWPACREAHVQLYRELVGA
jgi:glycosyltransferase involved in cell wall biosynthesis